MTVGQLSGNLSQSYSIRHRDGVCIDQRVLFSRGGGSRTREESVGVQRRESLGVDEGRRRPGKGMSPIDCGGREELAIISARPSTIRVCVQLHTASTPQGLAPSISLSPEGPAGL